MVTEAAPPGDAAPGGSSALRSWLEDHWLLVVICVLFAARLMALTSFMTHVDDIGPLLDILRAEEEGLVAQVRQVRNWTYAPAQFLVQALFLRLADDHQGVLFWGRLPALIAWLLGLVASHHVLRWAFQRRPWVADVVVALQAVSWRGIIESSQGHNYATMLAVSTAMLASFLREGEALQGPPRPVRTGSPRDTLRLFALGLGLGCMAWVTYQALFVAAAGFLGLAALALSARRWDALPRQALLGVTFALPVSCVYLWHLRRVSHRGIPGWIPDASPGGALDITPFLLRSWFAALQNDVTFLPWGPGSVGLAGLVLVVIALGAARWIRARRPLTRRGRAAVVFLLGVLLVFSAGPVLRLFPLGSTRHSYALQVPILFALGCGLHLVGIGPRLTRIVAVIVLISGALTTTWRLLPATASRLDLDEVERLVADDPDLVVLGADWTWDHMLLLRAHPEWADRLHVIEARPALGALGPDRLLVLDHRRRPTALLQELVERGYGERETLQEVQPTGSTELIGDINGGNGAFVYLLRGTN